MQYRKLPHGNENISVIGMGTASIGTSKEEDMIEAIQYAMSQGVNFFDLASGHANTFQAFGKALAGKRDQVYLQIHFGANYETGEYGWTTNLDKIKASVSWQLSMLQTDYIDFGFIHCLDETTDIEAYKKSGALDYLLSLKEKGIIRHIGLSTHTPSIVNTFLDEGILDIVMFSINPAYDYQQGTYAYGEVDERQRMYQRCQKEGVAISVMKPFCGGQLLDEKKSPFHQALNEYQCIQYALEKPGVITVVPGARNKKDVETLLRYFEVDESEKDYSIISTFAPADSQGKCVYCKHCHPCPVGLDIALVNKYYDLSLLGDELAKDHYFHLEKTARDCIKCHHCDKRCPFHVEQSKRMKEIQNYFGK